MLQQYVPIVVKFLHVTTKGGVGSPSNVVSELLTHIVDVCWAPSSEPLLPPDSYLLPAESEIVFSHSFLFKSGRESICC